MDNMDFVTSNDEFNPFIELLPNQQAQTLLANPNLVYLETRSTGIGEFDEIFELIICDSNATPIFHSLVKPSLPISSFIQNRYQVSLSKLNSAPLWEEVIEQIREILADKTIAVYNSRLDKRLMSQSCYTSSGRRPRWINDLSFCGIMPIAEACYGSNNSFRVITLAQACRKAKVKYKPSIDILYEVQVLQKLIHNISISE